MSKKKKKDKFSVCWYNPSARKNECITLEEIYTGVLRYKEGSFECLVGIETEAVDTGQLLHNNSLHPNKRRRITRLQWSVHNNYRVGNGVQLCPRDISVAYAIITYLKSKGFYIP